MHETSWMLRFFTRCEQRLTSGLAWRRDSDVQDVNRAASRRPMEADGGAIHCGLIICSRPSLLTSFTEVSVPRARICTYVGFDSTPKHQNNEIKHRQANGESLSFHIGQSLAWFESELVRKWQMICKKMYYLSTAHAQHPCSGRAGRARAIVNRGGIPALA